MHTDETGRRRSGTKVALVVFTVLGAAAVYRWWPGDERAIKQRLSGLAATITAASHAADVDKVTRVAALRGYFAPNVKIRSGTEEIVSRDAVMGLFSGWTPPPGGLVVDLDDVQVAVDGNGVMGDVHLTATVTSRDTRTGESTVDSRESTIGMIKTDGDWVVASVDLPVTSAPGRP